MFIILFTFFFSTSRGLAPKKKKCLVAKKTEDDSGF